MRHAWIISCGTELTLGQTPDTNAAWLAARLAGLGLHAVRHLTVPDELAALREVVLQAAADADVVLVTGGLGPTVDDLARGALADAAGAPLELHPPSLEQMRAFFAARGREMPDQNAVQALIPRGGVALPNDCGTAPGVRLVIQGTPCFALPGVPFEMRSMFARCVAPELRLAAAGAVIRSRQLHTFGLGESDLGARIADLMVRGRNPEVGTTAAYGIVGVRINATANNDAAADTLLNEAEAEIRRRLGVVVFGRDDETLAGVVGAALASQGLTLATAESCTGGLVGSLITEVPGSSRYFRGGIIAYENDVKADVLGVDPVTLQTHGAVSELVADQMAEGAARVLGAACALAVTGIAGPAGGTPEKPVGLVYVGMRVRDETTVHGFRFGHDAPRELIRLRAARTALNLLRLRLGGEAGR